MDMDTLDIYEGEEALDNPSPWLIGGLVVAAGLALYWYTSSSVETEQVSAGGTKLQKTQEQKEVAAIKAWLRKFRPDAPGDFNKIMFKLNKVESREVADEDAAYYNDKNKKVTARKDKDIVYQLKLDYTPTYLEHVKKEAPDQPYEYLVLVTPDLKVVGLGETLALEPRFTEGQTERTIRMGRAERQQFDDEDAILEAEADLIGEENGELSMTGMTLTRSNRRRRSRSRRNGLVQLPSIELNNEEGKIKIGYLVAGAGLALGAVGLAIYFVRR